MKALKAALVSLHLPLWHKGLAISSLPTTKEE